MAEDKGQTILAIVTKRGFIYPTAEMYGATAGFWTYGHLGTLTKRKWENLWRDYFLGLHDNFFEIEGSYILPEKVFESSGHLKNFNDPLVSCTKCKFRVRADQILEEALKKNSEGLTLEEFDKELEKNKVPCPSCKNTGWTKAKSFNMMFDVKIGAVGGKLAYLSPETAQNPYLAYKRQMGALREKLPMGLAMLGRVFRNEISPRQGFYRLREFHQAELQIFFDPETMDTCEQWDEVKEYKLRFAFETGKGKVEELSCANAHKKIKLPKMYLFYAAKMQQFYLETIQIPREKFRLRELDDKERAFYNKIHFDLEVNLETLGGFKEVGGLHYRGDHDLGGHQKGSKKKLETTSDGKKILPHVLELSFGVDRNIWTLLDIFFTQRDGIDLFAFPSAVAPVEVAVFPLVKNKEEIVKKAWNVYDSLRKSCKTFYDQSGSVGRRYARADEQGIPYCITVDFDKGVTIRDRDSTKQVRVDEKDLPHILFGLLNGTLEFSKVGKKV